jgi:NAD(P)-dependent dehydrogenase (short-subunit alcohol dehydrogenase family)
MKPGENQTRPADSPRAPISPEAVFLVSGGARGITAACVIAMARRYRCTFILLGRSARHVAESAWVAADASEADLKRQVSTHMMERGQKPTPATVGRIVRGILAEREITATLDAIAQAGGSAEYVSVDVTDAAALQAALPPVIERTGPVTGIIHGAGSLADKLIEHKTQADFAQVYTVKIVGLDNILTCVPPESLHHLVLFSSVAGFYGNAGQADYALANDMLNKTAHRIQRMYPACHVVAINWGPWDGGMVTPALRQHFAQQNIALIATDDGVAMLLHELEQPQPATQVVIGHPTNRERSLPTGDLQTWHVRRTLSLAANPFLLDHVIGGNAVLAAVFGVSWMTNTFEQLYPGYTFFSMHDYKVLKGIVFDHSLADYYTLDLRETARTEQEIVCDAMIRSTTPEGKTRYHYAASQVTLRRQHPAPPVYAPIDLSVNDGRDGATLYQDGTLFHGPSFQGVEKVLNVSETHVTTQCHAPVLSLEQQGQFPIQTFNPYLTDIQFQCMLVWVRRYHSAGGMPLGAHRVEQYRTIAPGQSFYVSMDVQSTSATRLVATVTAHDAQGQMFMRVQGAEVTISTRLNELFAQSQLNPAAQAETTP